jgi:hypothetical protein
VNRRPLLTSGHQPAGHAVCVDEPLQPPLEADGPEVGDAINRCAANRAPQDGPPYDHDALRERQLQIELPAGQQAVRRLDQGAPRRDVDQADVNARAHTGPIDAMLMNATAPPVPPAIGADDRTLTVPIVRVLHGFTPLVAIAAITPDPIGGASG